MGSRVDYVRKKYAPLLDKTLQNALAHRIGTEFPRIGGPRVRALCATMILQRKAVRLCEQAYAQNGLLSNCDLAELLGAADSRIADVLGRHERRTGRPVPRRATVHDVGTSLTHKRIICRKRYAEGKDVPQIARETYHSLESVDRYLGQYDRVRHCRLEGMTPVETAHALDCSVWLVNEYLAIDDELGANNG